MVKVLDKSRDFGEVYGSESGVRYVQDGLEFDAQENLLTAGETTTVSETKPGKPRGRPKATATVFSTDEQILEQEGVL